MSKIVAILPVRNEAWCIGLTLRALLMWVDCVVIGLHSCTDPTADILTEIIHEGDESDCGSRISWMKFDEQSWTEMAHRNALLENARSLRTLSGESASHIVIVDCDEILSGNLLPTIRQMVLATPRGSVLQLPWVQLKGSVSTYISSGMWSQQCASTAFPDDPAYHWAARNGYDHHHRHPMGKPLAYHMPLGRNVMAGGIMHGQMISERRLRAKQKWYVLTEATRWPGRKTYQELNAMYGPTVHCKDKLEAVPAEWWAPYQHLLKYLDLESEPWQEKAAQEMIDKYGRDYFAGLDLFE